MATANDRWHIKSHMYLFLVGIADTVLGSRQFIIFLMTLLVTLPLSLYRNISRLSKVSLLIAVGIVNFLKF